MKGPLSEKVDVFLSLIPNPSHTDALGWRPTIPKCQSKNKLSYKLDFLKSLSRKQQNPPEDLKIQRKRFNTWLRWKSWCVDKNFNLPHINAPN